MKKPILVSLNAFHPKAMINYRVKGRSPDSLLIFTPSRGLVSGILQKLLEFTVAGTVQVLHLIPYYSH